MHIAVTDDRQQSIVKEEEIKEGPMLSLQLHYKIRNCSAHDTCVRALISLANTAKRCFAQKSWCFGQSANPVSVL